MVFRRSYYQSNPKSTKNKDTSNKLVNGLIIDNPGFTRTILGFTYNEILILIFSIHTAMMNIKIE